MTDNLAHQAEYLRKKHSDWVASLKANGRKVIAYMCPCCEEPIQTLKPDPSAVADSITTCPHCGASHYKVLEVNRRGAVLDRSFELPETKHYSQQEAKL